MFVITLQLFEGGYEPNFGTIEYTAKNIIRDIARKDCRNGKLLYTEDEIKEIILKAYTIAGSQNPQDMLSQKLWFAKSERWVVEVK
jgi:hypothetical protein